jgi:superfamily II DNA or RNA helicase
MISLRETAIYVHLEGDSKELSALINETKIQPPSYWRADSYQLYKMTNGEKGWDGYMRLIERSAPGVGKALRGLQDSIIEAAKKLGIELNRDQLIKSPFHGLVVDDVPDDLIVADFELDGNQRSCIASWLNHGHGVHKVTVSGGKCLGKGTKVLMFNGETKNVEDVGVDDLLMGPDSTPRRVLSLARGNAEMFKVCQANGDDYICNDEHILCLQTTGMTRKKKKILPGTERLMTARKFFSLAKSSRTPYKGFKVGVEFPTKSTPMDPYVMGLWLGDGISSGRGIVVADADPEIHSYLNEWSTRNGLHIRYEPGHSCQTLAFSANEPGWWKNNFRTALTRLGLLNNKHIHKVFLINSRAVRLQLLAGLVDSDGHHAHRKNGTVILGFSNHTLADQSCWLARSLGFRATLSEKISTIKSTGFSGPTWRVYISGDLRCLPTKVARKRVTTQKHKGALRCAVDIESIGPGEYFGFELDGDHRFLLGDFTVTHNTAMFCAAASMIKRRFPDSRFLYLTPTERLVNQVYREARKFLPEWDITQFGGGKKKSDGKDMVIATAACIHANYDELAYERWFRTFMTALVDECFPAGTLIDERPIETIKVGDIVNSWNGTRVEKRRVVRLFKNVPTSLVKVTLKDGTSVVCTPNHPIWVGKWVPAINLRRHDVVKMYDSSRISEKSFRHSGHMLCMRGQVQSSTAYSLLQVNLQSKVESWVLFNSMQESPPQSHSVQCVTENLSHVLSSSFVLQPGSVLSTAAQGLGVLFNSVQGCQPSENKFICHGSYECQVCFGQDDGKQPNEKKRDTRENFEITFWPSISKQEGWKRQFDSSTKNLGHCLELADRSIDHDEWGDKTKSWTKMLCCGHSVSETKVGHRSGWEFALHFEASQNRQVENDESQENWVDHVEILEPGSDGKFGGLCPDGFVYNFEVDGTHTYFANGLLVHNCHHSSSASWERILLTTPAFFRLGASDTTRQDDIVAFSKIHGLVGPIRNVVQVDPLIRIGRVAKPTIYIADNPAWRGRFSHVPHVAEPDSPAWVLLDNEWKKATYIGPVFEKAEPNKKTGDFRKGEEDGYKRDKKGELIQVQNQHRVLVGKDEHEMESRWCLLERTNDQAIVQFKERNALIAQWAKHFSDQGHPTLVVATRTLHILILQASIAKLVNPDLVRILFSNHDSKERDETFEWLKTTPGAVLITPLVKEGVSINEIRGGIVADHVVSHELMSQIIGRFIRQKKTGKNECEIVMFLDRQHPRLQKNGLALVEQLEKIRGYDFVTGVLGPDTKANGKLYQSAF